MLSRETDKTRGDLQYIVDGWVRHINSLVSRDELMSKLEKLISGGISSGYLVFVFDYVVRNRLRLRYPAGFKYFVYDPSIKKLYERTIVLRQKEFINNLPPSGDDVPAFAYTVRKSGFGDILKQGSQNK